MARIDDAIKNLTVEELDLLNSDPEMLAAFKNKYGEEKTSMIGKAWDALKIPEQMSREGLGMIADAVPDAEPTGNLVRDIALNVPKVAAETIAETAPGFISRESIVTGGALKGGKFAAPAIKGLGKGLAKAAESLSGLEHKTPGVLTEAAKDSSLIFGQGTKKAGKLFEQLQEKGRIRPSFARATDHKGLVDDALKALDDGSITPEEALIARRSLDKIKRTLPGFSYKNMRDSFDAVAKTKSAQADKAFSRAVKSDTLRSPFAINKQGGTSAFKLGAGAVTGTLPFTMPVIQGSLATLLGLAGRGAGVAGKSPIRVGGSVGALLDLINSNSNLR